MPELQSTILRDKTSLVGYWKLENVNDSSTSGYNLTNNGTATFTSGKFGNAGTFNGSSQSLTIADASCPNLEISGSQTWTCWVKPASVTGETNIMTKRTLTAATARHILIQNAGTVYWGLYGLTTNQEVASDITIGVGVWSHLAGVYDSVAQKLTLYVNGQAKTVAASGAAGDSNAPFAIGAGYNGTSDALAGFFNGQIDDAAIFNTALSADQIKELYEGRYVGEGWPQTGLVGAWHLSNTTDFSGSNYHLTNQGTATFPLGKFNGAVSLNGSNQWLEIADASCPNLEISGARTYSMWIKPASLAALGVILSKSASGIYHQVYVNTNGTISVEITGLSAGVTSTNTVNTTAWHYVVAIYTGSTIEIYINGKGTSTSSTGSGTDTNGLFYIGRNFNGNYFNGLVDEVQIYNVAKDANWVRKQYAWGMGRLI